MPPKLNELLNVFYETPLPSVPGQPRTFIYKCRWCQKEPQKSDSINRPARHILGHDQHGNPCPKKVCEGKSRIPETSIKAFRSALGWPGPGSCVAGASGPQASAAPSGGSSVEVAAPSAPADAVNPVGVKRGFAADAAELAESKRPREANEPQT